MGKLILYGIEASPPVRGALLSLNALGLDFEYRDVNLLANEHQSEEFIKKNPQHTVPLLEDDGKFIWDSHAIMAYLMRKYGKNDDLYPKDFYQRAVVDQRLHFDSGILFPSLRNITFPIIFKNVTEIPQEKIRAVHDGYNFLEAFLQQDYLAGDTLTVADLSALSTVTSLNVLSPIDPAKNPKLAAWVSRLVQLPYYENANGKGLAMFTELVKSKLAGN